MVDIKVSVVMAVYNSEKYLRQAVNSLLFQSLSDIEIILVDDGSADESLAILREYEKSDGRIRVLQNTVESDGAAAARNLGISVAKGKYISVVDADDFFEPDMLEKAYECAERYNVDVTIFDGFRYDDLNRVDLERDTILCSAFLPRRDRSTAQSSNDSLYHCSSRSTDSGDGSFCFSPEENRDDLFRMTLGAAWNCLFSTELIRQHDLRFAPFHHADDLEFVYTAFALAERIAILPKRLLHYRVNHAGTQASMVSLWPDTAWQAMLSLKNRLVKEGVFDRCRVAFIRVAAKYQLFYLSAMKDVDSFRRLYNELKGGRLAELGIADATPQELGDATFIKQRDIILREEADGYLFAKMNGLPPFDEAISWKKRIERGSRLVVYGADRLGVEVVHSILWNQDYKLVSWVDDQFESLGYPVGSPEEIKGEEYDFILVVSRSGDIFERRKNWLIDIGIDESRIRWQNE